MSINRFSSTLQLSDFDDFITPSQECIKPINVKKSGVTSQGATVGIKGKEKLKKVEITLNDCLACSGCITSAETVLVTSQSHQQFTKIVEEIACEEKKRIIIISISEQVRASLAVENNISHADISTALSNYFTTKYHVKHVLDTSFAHQLSLLESSQEFIQRFQQHKSNPDDVTTSPLPLMTSSCPGWICYAEKTHGKLLIPHLSRVKSAQQITGSLVKRFVSRHYDVTPDRVYHVTVMPCYDKKLEASREDFYDDVYQTRDVDLVLTSGEIMEMLRIDEESLKDFVVKKTDDHNDVIIEDESVASKLLRSTSLTTPPSGENCTSLTTPPSGENSTSLTTPPSGENSTSLTTPPSGDNCNDVYNGGSGGYLEYVMKNAAKQLFNIEIDQLQYQPTRNNKDFQEVKLCDDKGEVLFNFALAYGFRSIQNVVRKMKQKKCNYHYIEVMACPSGCLNGGGQVKEMEGGSKEKERVRLQRVVDFYRNMPQSTHLLQRDTDDDVTLKRDDVIVDEEKDLMTSYHAVEKNENISVKW